MTGRVWVDAIDQRGDSKAFKKEFETEEQFEAWVDSWVAWGGKIVGVRDINSWLFDWSDAVRKFIGSPLHNMNWWESWHYVMKLSERAVKIHGVAVSFDKDLVMVSDEDGFTSCHTSDIGIKMAIAEALVRFMEEYKGFNQ